MFDKKLCKTIYYTSNPVIYIISNPMIKPAIIAAVGLFSWEASDFIPDLHCFFSKIPTFGVVSLTTLP